MIQFGQHWSFNYLNDPKRLGFVLARYQVASRLIGESESILEVGCSEGIGLPFFLKTTEVYMGIDIDGEAISAAQQRYKDLEGVRMETADILSASRGEFSAVVSLDVIEHIDKGIEDVFLRNMVNHCKRDGLMVIGTPNLTSEFYQSELSRLGHVNLFDSKRLHATLAKYFERVVLFGMNDEVLHTGDLSCAHYLLALAQNKRTLL